MGEFYETEDIAPKTRICPNCGTILKLPIYQKAWFWVLVVFVALTLIGGILQAIGKNNGTVEPNTPGASGQAAVDSTEPSTINPKDAVFSGDCGISASGQMGTTIINYPELKISIKNTTNKDIAAISFYAVPYDVYGDEIKGWTTQKKLYTDTAIRAGASTNITYSFIEDSVKTLKLYVYSVYFSDGTEWGDKDALESTILKNGTLIQVSGES